MKASDFLDYVKESKSKGTFKEYKSGLARASLSSVVLLIKAFCDSFLVLHRATLDKIFQNLVLALTLSKVLSNPLSGVDN